jgi:Iron-sulfur cluster assembly protein
MDRAAIATTRAQVYEALHEVYDPVLAVNILDLGLVYAVELNEEGSSWRRGIPSCWLCIRLAPVLPCRSWQASCQVISALLRFSSRRAGEPHGPFAVCHLLRLMRK